MAVTLNTGDALYSALSHIFLVDDDNTIKELKAGLTCTPHANVLLPGTGSTSSPVGRSFRTGGVSDTTAYGVDFPEYACSNAGALTVFISFNQYNSVASGLGAYAAMTCATPSSGIRVGAGWMIDPSTGCWSPHNNATTVTSASLTKTTGSITGGGVTSIAFSRNGLGTVKAYINGALDSAFTGGVSNSGSIFGANWSTATMGSIGGKNGSGWLSMDYVHWCDFIGTVLTDSDVQRLHDSLTGSNAFALVNGGGSSTSSRKRQLLLGVG